MKDYSKLEASTNHSVVAEKIFDTLKKKPGAEEKKGLDLVSLTKKLSERKAKKIK